MARCPRRLRPRVCPETRRACLRFSHTDIRPAEETRDEATRHLHLPCARPHLRPRLSHSQKLRREQRRMRARPDPSGHQIWSTERRLERQRVGVSRGVLRDGGVLHRKRCLGDLRMDGQSRIQRLELGHLAGVPPDEGMLGAGGGGPLVSGGGRGMGGAGATYLCCAADGSDPGGVVGLADLLHEQVCPPRARARRPIGQVGRTVTK